MYRYLLDTSILSQIISVVAEKIADLERGEFCICVIMACELRYRVEGCRVDSPLGIQEIRVCLNYLLLCRAK